MIKLREKLEITDVTSISMGKGGKTLEIMLRAIQNRQRQFVMSNTDQRLQMGWAIRQAFRVQTGKSLKVFDEQGDEFSNKLDELCL